MTVESSDDVIVTVGKGKITFQGTASLSAVNIDFNKVLNVTNSTKFSATVKSDVKIIDASARTTVVKITGNKLDNTIIGGSGKNTLYGFDSKDTLTLDGLDFTTSYSKSKGTITFKVDGGSVVLKDFTASTFHVNDDVYKISGSKFKKQ